MKKLFKICALCMLLYSCSKNSDNSTIDSQNIEDEMHTLFDELLPERIVSTLIYMGTEMGYSIDLLEDYGNVLVSCQGDADCFTNSLDNQFIQDYTTAHFPATAPELQLNVDDNSVWISSYDVDNAIIIFQHNTLNIQIEVDAYTGISGGLPMGVTPVIDGERIEAISDNLKRRFIQPTEDGGIIKKAIITLEGETINVRFEGGTYGQLFAQGGWCEICDVNDPETIFMESQILINEFGQFETRMEGLYYFWFKKSEMTTLGITAGDIAEQYSIFQNTYFTSYIPDVTHVLINDEDFGVFDVATNSSMLQVQSNQFTYPDLWQLDFDHNYKDTGQKSVPTTVIVN